MDNEELKYWLAFTKLNLFRHKNFLFYKKFFDSLQSFWTASISALTAAKVTEQLANNFVTQRKDINPDQELDILLKHGINVLLFDDADYPKLLKEISSPPLLLFYRGNHEILQQQLFAIVGTRRFSSYGKQISIKLSQEVINNKLIPVSGLAFGIDTLVHKTCVENNYPTVAVLGSGIDDASIYPRSNYRLAREIINNNGIIISEYAPETEPLKHHFPARNRLISGLSLGTLVTEARQKSGALITAHFALEQNREVFAIPGPITQSTSDGTNNLIKLGAKAVTNIQDILDELNIPQRIAIQKTCEVVPDSTEETEILNQLSTEPKHINEIASACQKSITYINAKLLLLEMKGRVSNLGNMHFILKV
ncbi:MAG: hypothetical protein UT32_C0008G0004 [Parcubacteria group bacterium GW2011_GWC2_39_14]|nr:MAG: hypothetical protein UT32_C0008G0004 [Parcubacteria group bacterium GW2011_GWC2_39_14]KKR54931.1 MAG: hypothetical protein UT91_C0007G0032 [Parcubacteria group bacterium GW2011_GWA2_40_23]